MTPSERGRGSLSEISHSSKLLPGSAEAPTLRTVKFLVAPSTERMNAGAPPWLCNTATYWADGGASVAGVFTSTTCVRGLGRRPSGHKSGCYAAPATIATSAVALSAVKDASLRQRRAC